MIKLFLFLALFPTISYAQTIPNISKTPNEIGEVNFGVELPPHREGFLTIQSVGIISQGGSIIQLCFSGTNGQTIRVTHVFIATADSVSYLAYSFSELNCSGLMSIRSPNKMKVTFKPQPGILQ